MSAHCLHSGVLRRILLTLEVWYCVVPIHIALFDAYHSMNIKIFRFSIPFRSNLIINNIDLENRQGIIVSVSYKGQIGFGEASPLESFSKETLSDVLWALEGLIVAVDNCSIGEARELAKLHLSSAPSAAFAFDTALYDLEAKINNKALRYFINAEALEHISVNALIDEDLSLSNKTFKVKFIYGSNYFGR